MNAWNREIVKAVVQMLNNYKSGPLSIQYVADRAGYSPCHLQRLFRLATGKTLGSYIRALKLCRAADELLESNMTISYIHQRYGFTTHQAFTRAFIRRFDKSPAHWRAFHLSNNKAEEYPELNLIIKCLQE